MNDLGLQFHQCGLWQPRFLAFPVSVLPPEPRSVLLQQLIAFFLRVWSSVLVSHVSDPVCCIVCNPFYQHHL